VQQGESSTDASVGGARPSQQPRCNCPAGPPGQTGAQGIHYELTKDKRLINLDSLILEKKLNEKYRTYWIDWNPRITREKWS
jgi:hypothetical protein